MVMCCADATRGIPDASEQIATSAKETLDRTATRQRFAPDLTIQLCGTRSILSRLELTGRKNVLLAMLGTLRAARRQTKSGLAGGWSSLRPFWSRGVPPGPPRLGSLRPVAARRSALRHR